LGYGENDNNPGKKGQLKVLACGLAPAGEHAVPLWRWKMGRAGRIKAHETMLPSPKLRADAIDARKRACSVEFVARLEL
jgi:hypothetical protein